MGEICVHRMAIHPALWSLKVKTGRDLKGSRTKASKGVCTSKLRVNEDL